MNVCITKAVDAKFQSPILVVFRSDDNKNFINVNCKSSNI